MKRGRTSVVFAAALALALFSVGVPAAASADETSPSPSIGVMPLDAIGCTGTYAGNQIENCVAIYGDAQYLNEVDGIAWTHFGSVTGHEEITGPSIPNGHLNSPTQQITTTDNGALVSWRPDGPVSDGNYCAIFWQNVNGGYSENGPACDYVS